MCDYLWCKLLCTDFCKCQPALWTKTLAKNKTLPYEIPLLWLPYPVKGVLGGISYVDNYVHTSWMFLMNKATTNERTANTIRIHLWLICDNVYGKGKEKRNQRNHLTFLKHAICLNFAFWFTENSEHKSHINKRTNERMNENESTIQIHKKCSTSKFEHKKYTKHTAQSISLLIYADIFEKIN